MNHYQLDFKVPSELKLTGNLEENWKKFYQRLQFYLPGTEKGNEVKMAILLNLVGEEALEVYNTFKFKETNFDEAVKQFGTYCKVRKNILFERHRFFKCRRQQGQPLENHLTQSKTLAAGCEFEQQEDYLIRDHIVLTMEDAC
ncbi:hypothetical protein JTB14_034053 [Gonioctena quinquepunctata]|nr:hypothetical protein JTB14_034053 [Gonioctena quinquepunctata]